MNAFVRWSVGVLALVLLGTAAGGASAWLWFRSWLDTPLRVASAEGEVLEIAPGESFARTARSLADRGLLEHPRWLVLLARWRGDAVRIKAGEYRITGELTPPALLDRLVAGDVILHSLTLVEGWTVREAVAAVRAHASIRVTDATADPALLHDAMGVVPGTPPCGPTCTWASVEGQLFPDTYRFPGGTSDIELLRQSRQRLEEVLTASWARRADSLPFDTPYEALVLASIVEKETALASERPRIAGVFVRRLRRDMRLQSDPTVIYGAGAAYAGDITRAHLRTDTPWNTYTRKGLPPTPIALAGREALEAAVAPAPGDSLYFVASGRDDGSHHFSATLAEHNAAVRRYLERTGTPAQARQSEEVP